MDYVVNSAKLKQFAEGETLSRPTICYVTEPPFWGTQMNGWIGDIVKASTNVLPKIPRRQPSVILITRQILIGGEKVSGIKCGWRITSRATVKWMWTFSSTRSTRKVSLNLKNHNHYSSCVMEFADTQKKISSRLLFSVSQGGCGFPRSRPDSHVRGHH